MSKILSILIPAYNEGKTIHLILDKIIAVNLPENLDKEIIIVNMEINRCNNRGALRIFIG